MYGTGGHEMRKQIRRQFLTGLTGILALLLVLPAAVYAQVPETFRYEGYLQDSGGDKVAKKKTMDLTFTLYDASTGGTPLWQESHIEVAVDKGAYSIVLGRTIPLTLSFDQQLYLEVEIDSDGTILPREPLTSFPSALNADVADYAKDAGLLGGMSPSDLEESAEIDADVAAHAAIPDAHHAKTTDFAELTTGQAANAQIQDDAVTGAKISFYPVGRTRKVASLTQPKEVC
jgi:hypothetical protein